MKQTVSRILYFAFIALLAVAMVDGDALAKKKKKKKKKKDGPPEWVYKPGLYEDVIIAAGVGEGFSERKAKSQAAQNGRKQIAEALQTEIKSMTTNFMEEASSITETEEGEEFESAAQEYFQEVTRSMTKQTLNGSFIEEYWPPLGERVGRKVKFYAKVVLKKSAVVEAFREKVKEDAAAKKIKGVKLSADNALTALDKAIDKWENDSNKGPLEDVEEEDDDE